MKEEVKEEAAPAKRRLTLGKPAFMQGTTVTRRTVVGQEEITEESGLSKGVDALKEEVKSLGDNLSRIALVRSNVCVLRILFLGQQRLPLHLVHTPHYSSISYHFDCNFYSRIT